MYPKTFKCAYCEKETENKRKRIHPKCCSKECSKKLVLKRSRVVVVCDNCKKEFLRRKCFASKKTLGRFCSRRCSALWMSANGHHYKSKGWKARNGYFESCKDGKKIRRCRCVIEEVLGRKLARRETVHHKNGIRDDDRIENLELWDCSHPYGQRVSDKIAWAVEFLRTYNYIITLPYNDLEICKVIAPQIEKPVAPTTTEETTP